MSNNTYAIHSIRRLADNATFTVGDKVQIEDEAFAIGMIELTHDIPATGFIIRENKGHIGCNCNAKECQPYKLPTLAEVYEQVKPKWFLSSDNDILKANYNKACDTYNHLSAEAQVKQLQDWISLRVIADWSNGEASWTPKNGESYFTVEIAQNDYRVTVEQHAVAKFSVHPLLQIEFKQRDHAEAAISILKEAGLLDALKG